MAEEKPKGKVPIPDKLQELLPALPPYPPLPKMIAEPLFEQVFGKKKTESTS